MKTILITGITGFIGSALAAKFIEEPDIELIYLTDSETAKNRAITAVNLVLAEYGMQLDVERKIKVALCKCLTDVEAIKECLKELEVDEVWHIAAHMSYDFSELSESIKFNAVISTNIMSQLKKCGRYYYISSTGTAGLGEFNGIEKQVPEELLTDFESVNPYTASKVLAEYMLWNESSKTNIPLTILRPGSVIGDSNSGWVNNTKYGYYSYLHILKRFINKNMTFYLDIDPNKKFPVIHIDHLINLCTFLRNRKVSKTKMQEIFHACNQNLLTAKEHFLIFEELSVGNLKIGFGEGKEGFNKVFNTMNKDNNKFLGVNLTYDNSKLIESIGLENIPPPLTKKCLINVFKNYLEKDRSHAKS
ncbi:NAD-dependent epimerase/dehydratase family protein [Lysinibacillus sp. Bpr_S20]|uniref:SDR family oxidoreductase n=1 Tax=Lysinibacillus sp. Bpr_S20 TaxID=2933964 RepID=UPI002012D52A|nr:NAD-dependent epimerase/dehydratase family protein [Lysinibacillus sp. Bpr_S20]MCL1702977.1 SDR family oxidoreductase [Lysinibacillus sp. Bpr_S20]